MNRWSALWLLFGLTVCFVAQPARLVADHHEDAEAEEAEAEDKAPQTSIFPDKNLEEAVRKSVFEKRYNKEPITADDVKNISTVTGKGMGIRDLTGMEHCRRLAALDLEDNKIVDLSPIADLKELQTVTLNDNTIRNIAPLGGLTRLQYIQLEDNRVEDISPLAPLENLNSLYLSRNKIVDIGAVAGLKKLWSLYLDDNQIEDLEPIAGLVRLSTLSFSGNPVSDVNPLAKLRELNLLMMERTKVEDLAVLVDMAKKDRDGDNRFAMFWRLYLADNPLSDEAREKQLTVLAELGGRVHAKSADDDDSDGEKARE